MYDTYSRYIYEWLVNNKIASKLDSIIELLGVLRDRAVYIFIVLLFILLVTVAFKFITVRGRNV
nr:unnamed protein product [uncultured bacterium]